jgi:acyl-CoA synthetase
MRFPEPDAERSRQYHAAGHWRHDTIPALILRQAAARPSAIAVRDASGAAVTYGNLATAAAAVSGYLAARGVGRGDIVTACLPNWWQAVAVFLGVQRIGAVINPVPTTYGRADLEFVLGKCESKALFVPGRFRSVDFTETIAKFSTPELRGLPVVRIGDGRNELGVPFDAVLRQPPVPAAADVSADAPAAVLFTSGTESRPKGAVHTHNTILFGERAMARAMAVDAGDTAFMASPISHATGFLHGYAMTLTLGGTLSLLDIFSGEAAARQMREHRCSWTMGATPFLADIAEALAATKSALSDLRYFLCGGAPVPEPLVRRATGIGLRVLSIYGATESPPHTIVHPEDPVENAWISDGRPLAGIEVMITGEDGAPMPAGEIGEERSRGPNTFIGYLGEPELTAKDFDAQGWYRSGDLARQFADGSIRIVGRLKDIIVRGGQNISVREVEDYLSSHPAVKSVAVVAVPHPRLGETGCAVVVLNPGHALTLPDLDAFLGAKGVAKFKVPERLELWPSLPTTPSGKIQKFLIRKQLGDRTGGTTT